MQSKKLAWFSHLLRHSARKKRGGLILQRSRAHTGQHVNQTKPRHNLEMWIMSVSVTWMMVDVC